jgi:cell division protein FtsI/penicillin-binding protein 2
VISPLFQGSKSGADHAGRFTAVSFILVAGISFALLVMLARVTQLQLRPSVNLQEHIEPRVTRRTELEMRGDLTDKKGRLLSATRFGERVICDPTLLPLDLDAAITKLAGAIERPAEEVGQKVLAAIVENQRRQTILDASKPKPTTKPPIPIISKFLQRSPSRSPSAPAEGVAESSKPGVGETDDSQNPDSLKKPIRYLALSTTLTDEQSRAVRSLHIPGISLEKQQVREYPGGPEIAPIVGKVAYDHTGQLGAEKMLETDLEGDKGYITFVRDAHSNPIWIEPKGIQPARSGEDVKLSIDLEVQRMAAEELAKGVEDCDAAGGRCVVVDPISGEVLAMVDIIRTPADAEPFPWADDPTADLKKQRDEELKARGLTTTPTKRGKKPPPLPRLVIPPAPPMPSGHHRWIINKPDPSRDKNAALARNRCIEDVYEPGSTFKPFVWSTITELGLATPDEVFDTHNGSWITPDGRPIKDVHTAATMTWSQVLVNSSNIGMIQGAHRLSYQQLHDAVVRFGFGRPMGIGLPGEGAGVVTPMKSWSKSTQTSVAFGNEVAVTPIQMCRAFSAFARPGDIAGTLPRLRLTALDQSTNASAGGWGVTYRVLPANIAALTRETMRGVTGAMETKYAPPPEGQEWRYTIFGKSGTAKIPTGHAPENKRAPRGCPGYLDQYRSSFIAGGPIEDPRLVVLVIMDDPGPSAIAKRRHYGAATAGPVVRKVMERTLAYMGVPASPQAPSEPLALNN